MEEDEKKKIPEEVRECFSKMGLLEMEMLSRVAGLVPGDFVEHMFKARKEVLLAFRSLIDTAIEKTEDRQETWVKLATKKDATPEDTGPRKITLE